jgi:tetratricopeptide (TPR) repeat protein
MRFLISFKVLWLALTLALGNSRGLAESVSELMVKGDAFDVKFQAADALKIYLAAEKMEPNSLPLAIRIARQYRHLMTDTKPLESKIIYGKYALAYAQRAATLGPQDSEAQLSPAITYGKLSPLLGSKERVEFSPLIKESVDKALKLDPQNDLAWHVLGRWHQALAEIGGVKRTMSKLLYGTLPATTNEESVKCFEKAISINPNRLRHYIELGITYAHMNRSAEARQNIEKGLAMPDSEKDDAELKVRGREVMGKLK